MSTQPWHGVVVASALPFRADLSVDFDAFADHVRWLAQNGCRGITPNGSLGEYSCLTTEERAKVVEIAVETAPEGFSVVPGTGAYGSGRGHLLGRTGQGRRRRCGAGPPAQRLPRRRRHRVRPL